MNQTIHNLLTEQLASWETARNNYAALSGVQVKELNVNGTLYKVQFQSGTYRIFRSQSRCKVH